jgi:hypothetical protein
MCVAAYIAGKDAMNMRRVILVIETILPLKFSLLRPVRRRLALDLFVQFDHEYASVKTITQVSYFIDAVALSKPA